jgi:hypothetical protein
LRGKCQLVLALGQATRAQGQVQERRLGSVLETALAQASAQALVEVWGAVLDTVLGKESDMASAEPCKLRSLASEHRTHQESNARSGGRRN